MKKTHYTAYFSDGTAKEIWASGLISALVKSMKGREHLEDYMPNEIVDNDHKKSYTDFSINYNTI